MKKSDTPLFSQILLFHRKTMNSLFLGELGKAKPVGGVGFQKRT